MTAQPEERPSRQWQESQACILFASVVCSNFAWFMPSGEHTAVLWFDAAFMFLLAYQNAAYWAAGYDRDGDEQFFR